MSWIDIEQDNLHTHACEDSSVISKELKKFIRKSDILESMLLYQVGFDGGVRMFGYKEGAIFYAIAFDANHKGIPWNNDKNQRAKNNKRNRK